MIDAKHPSAIMLENVASLETHDGGRTFAVIRDQLTRRGYQMTWLTADAQDYGFPQRRNRIYIVCFRDRETMERFSFPQKSELKIRLWDILDRSVKAPEWCYFQPDSEQYILMDRAIRDPREIYRFSDGRFATRSGVLSSREGVSFTLLAGMGNWHDREPVTRDRWGIRKLTPEECFLLQGYPDSFSLRGIPVKSAYRQAGNTVCVPVVRQIAEKMVSAMSAPHNRTEAAAPGLPQAQKVLVGLVRDHRQLEASLRAGFYHFPVRYLPEDMDGIRWAALFLPARITGEAGKICYVGRIRKYSVVPRRMIAELPRESNESFCRIDVNEWKPALRPPVVTMNLPVLTVQADAQPQLDI